MNFGAVRNILLVLTIGLLGLTTSAEARRHNFTFSADTSFTITGQARLEVDNEVGDITIFPGSAEKITVRRLARVAASDSAEAEEILSDIGVRYDFDQNALRIEADIRHKSRHFSVFDGLISGGGTNRTAVDFEIEVPQVCDVDIHTTSGDIDLSGLNGTVKIDATSGDMIIEEIKGRLDIEATSGDIQLTEADAEVSIVVSSGDVKARRIRGETSIKASSGDITLHDVTGNLNVVSSSGDQELSGITGSVTARATSGNIECTAKGGKIEIEASSGDARINTRLPEHGHCLITTTSGDVTLGLADDPGAEIEIDTHSGDIDDRVDVDWQRRSSKHRLGTYGRGSAQVRIQTGSGDVHLRDSR